MRIINFVFILVLIFASTKVLAHGNDDPLLTKFMLHQFEAGTEKLQTIDGEFWAGYDLSKIWVKLDWEKEDGVLEDRHLQILYNRAISPYFDMQAGWRYDEGIKGRSSRQWAAIGIQGLAPYFITTDATFFISEDGDSRLEIEAETELLFTQQIVLIPNMEVNFNGQKNEEHMEGSGLANIEWGLRLAYQVNRQFAPYFGFKQETQFGKTKQLAKEDGEDIRSSQWVLGIQAWF